MNPRWCCSFFVIAVLLSSTAGADELLPVIPQPRHVVLAEPSAASFDLCKERSVLLPAELEEAAGGIDQVNRRLKELGLAPLEIRVAGDASAIRLGIAPNEELSAKVSQLPEPKAEGYRMHVSAEGVTILGEDAAGLYYGLVTLAGLVAEEGRVRALSLSDWPDQKIRGTYVLGCDDWRQRIPSFAALKLNLVLFEDPSLYELDDAAVRKQWQDIFALCRRHFIEPVPELQSLGWGQYVLASRPRVAEGITVHRVPFQVADGQVAVPPRVAPPELRIRNPGFEAGGLPGAPGWHQEQPGGADSGGRGSGSFRETSDADPIQGAGGCARLAGHRVQAASAL